MLNKLLIIFDIDGTLTNTKKVDDKCFKSAFKETFGIDIENQNWEGLANVTDWGITEEIVLREKNRTPTSNEFEALTTNFIDKLNEEFYRDATQFDAVRGASQFLQHLKQRGYRMSIATGGWRSSAEMKLKVSSLDVEGIPCANSNDHKTREEIIQHSIHLSEVKYGSKFESVVYFGDGAWDYTTCKKLGLRFIGLDVNQDGKLRNLGAEHVFEDYRNAESIESILRR
jgi:phosphoglycolate phosphatase-like HAD superfamily hydrolase